MLDQSRTHGLVLGLAGLFGNRQAIKSIRARNFLYGLYCICCFADVMARNPFGRFCGFGESQSTDWICIPFVLFLHVFKQANCIC